MYTQRGTVIRGVAGAPGGCAHIPGVLRYVHLAEQEGMETQRTGPAASIEAWSKTFPQGPQLSGAVAFLPGPRRPCGSTPPPPRPVHNHQNWFARAVEDPLPEAIQHNPGCTEIDALRATPAFI